MSAYTILPLSVVDTLRNTLEEKVSQFAHQNAQLGEQLQMTVSECEQLRILVSQTSDERDHLKVLLDQLNADTEQSNKDICLDGCVGGWRGGWRGGCVGGCVGGWRGKLGGCVSIFCFSPV